MKKLFFLFAFCLILFSGFGLYSMVFPKLVSYHHQTSIEFYKTGIMDPSDYNGPAGSDIFSTVSVSRHFDGYYIWVNFASKTPGHELIIRRVELKSKTLNLTKEFGEAAYFETEDKGFFESYKLVFEALMEDQFSPSMKHFNLKVNYDLNGESYDVTFKVIRDESFAPIH